MAWLDAYATAEQYRAAVGKSDTGSDGEIDLDLASVSRYLELELGRGFNQTSANTAREFDGNGLAKLYIDDIITLGTTPVGIDTDRNGSFDDTSVVAADVVLWPYNAAESEWPYTAIYLLPANAHRAIWPVDPFSVRITGTWGWPTVPGPIQRDTIQLTQIWRVEGPRATNRISEGLDQVIGASSVAQRIVADLMKHYGKVTV